MLFFIVGLSFAASPPSNAPMVMPQKSTKSGMSTAMPANQGQTGLPDAPRDLHLTVRSATRIDLSWRYYNVSTEDGFIIERKTGENGDYKVIYANDRTKLLYEDQKVAANTTYFYRVRAFNRYGYTEPCPEAKATTPTGGPD